MPPTTAPAPRLQSLRRPVWEAVCRQIDGVAVGSTVAALGERGVFELLEREPGATLRRVLDHAGGNPGHLNVALRLLASQGWVTREGTPGTDEMRFTLTHEGRHGARLAPLYTRAAALLPEARDLLRAGSAGAAGMVGVLHGWAERVRGGWGIPRDGVPLGVQWQVRHHLDGHAAAPVMGLLALAGHLPASAERPEIDLSAAEGGTKALGPLWDVLAALGWATREGDRVTLTPPGEVAASFARQYWYPLSYLETFIRVPELLFGDAGALREGAGGGDETHVDRALDIAFSGGVFDRTCRGPFLEAVLPLFDQEPLSAQPTAVVDTGCGNGALLLALWEGVRDGTLRGRGMDAHPLVLVGVDPSPVARETTAARLAAAGAPHRVADGDVTDPAALARTLAALGVNPYAALHVSKSVIHNRTWRPPAVAPPADRIPRSTGAFAAPDGAIIPNVMVERNLAELFGAWLPLARAHGMLVIEAHTAPPEVVAELLGRTVSTLMDATHGYSGQLLVEPEVFVEAAREAGLTARSHRALGGSTGLTVLTLTHFVAPPT
ncbi:MAG TPA: hypothetical protein VEX86_28305 [Longimicrobium sp.]|nr:hypothetical protein [Longimicrobium sp.]